MDRCVLYLQLSRGNPSDSTVCLIESIAGDTERLEASMQGAPSIAHYKPCIASRTKGCYGAGTPTNACCMTRLVA
jgi:hypothetical protein